MGYAKSLVQRFHLITNTRLVVFLALVPLHFVPFVHNPVEIEKKCRKLEEIH